MELREHPNKTFMAKFERFEAKVMDSTMIQLAKLCKRKYFFQIVLARVPRKTAPYFAFGGAYHTFREKLEISYRDGNKEGDFKGAMEAALKKWDKEQGQDPPLGDKFDFMTRIRLMQTCAVAYDYWLQEKKNNKIQVIAIEQPFNVELAPDEFTSGRFDQIVRWNGKVWGRDFKTTSKDGAYYQRSHSPNDQFTRYTYAETLLAGERVQGQLIEAMYNAKSTKNKQNGPAITLYPVSRTDFELEDWLRDELQIRKELQLARENDVWPKNEGHCIFCHFHSVCKMPNVASQMSKLEYEFDVRPWDNTKVGVDE